jgi:hypothetical protein
MAFRTAVPVTITGANRLGIGHRPRPRPVRVVLSAAFHMSGSASFRTLAFAVLALLSVSGCTARNPQVLAPQVTVSRTVAWRVAEGDVITWRVYNDNTLSGSSVVAADGTVYAIALGRVPVAGLTLDSLKMVFAERYDKIIRDAAVDATVQRDLVVYGPQRAMTLVLADPSLTVLGLLAKSGTQGGQSPIVSLIHPNGSRELMPRDARLGSIDISRADGIYVEPSAFLARNASNFQEFAALFGFIAGLTGLALTFFK